MTNHSRAHLGRHLLVMTAVLLGTILLLIGLLPPQVARSREQQNPTPPHVARGMHQQEQNIAPPSAQGDQEAQDQEQVLDKDPQGNEYVAGELLVTYEKGASKQAKEEVPKKIGAKVNKNFPAIDVQHLSLPEVKNEQAREARQQALKLKKKVLEQTPDVKAVDYNYVREGAMVPSDPKYSEQWGFPKINAPYAWDTTQGSNRVYIAILDSGIDEGHPDLRGGKVPGEADFVTWGGGATDERGHGTHVAGTAAAWTNNKDANGNYVGVAGTCPNCTLINAKVLDAYNKGTDDRYVYAINWAADSGFDVINMSFGGYGKSTAVETAVNYAWNKGAVLVGAAGNDGNNGTEFYPAAYPNVIAVAATDSSDARATWDNSSTTDRVEASNAGSWVDVAAPGKNILSTTPSYVGGPRTCDGNLCYQQNYDYFYGTSMAAPHVSGLAGLILSKDGSLSPDQVRNQIQSTAKDLGTAGKDNVFGHGRIDAQAALKFTSRTYQENDSAITYNSASDWTKYSWSGASGGYTNWAYRSGATATFSFTGNSVTWWANKGSWAGKAYVYVDGIYVQTVDLYASSDQPSQAVYTRGWATSGSHTIKIYVEGTSGRPWVDVDRFTVTQRT